MSGAIPVRRCTSACRAGVCHGAAPCWTANFYVISMAWRLVAGGLGFEPRLAESESAVLPLDDPPTNQLESLGSVGSRDGLRRWRSALGVQRGVLLMQRPAGVNRSPQPPHPFTPAPLHPAIRSQAGTARQRRKRRDVPRIIGEEPGNSEDQVARTQHRGMQPTEREDQSARRASLSMAVRSSAWRSSMCAS